MVGVVADDGDDLPHAQDLAATAQDGASTGGLDDAPAGRTVIPQMPGSLRRGDQVVAGVPDLAEGEGDLRAPS